MVHGPTLTTVKIKQRFRKEDAVASGMHRFAGLDLRFSPEMSADTESIKAICRDIILVVFPDICPDHLDRIADEHQYDPEVVISFIADEAEAGRAFPKRPRAFNKRKREDFIEENAIKQFDSTERHGQRTSLSYIKLSMTLLGQAFPRFYVKDVYTVFHEKQSCLFPAYIALDRILDADEKGNGLRFSLKKYGTRAIEAYQEHMLEETIESVNNAGEREALMEFRAARQFCQERSDARQKEKQLAEAEVQNLQRARAEGSTAECGCCFDELALNRMVHCDGMRFHYFCRDCLRQMAEHQVGMSKHELTCPSMDECSSGFTRDQKALFLDQKTQVALERIEQEDVLRLAGIENLETCPFCPFAAEYPPVEENKEFRCENPECGVVSCRLCRRETHIPYSCVEAMQEAGLSARRVIEEAMSAALIRRCNKCNTPFIKQDGCNKMMCTKAGCHNVQCYICHKSCDYAHFNDSNRGGKAGNCPLYDNSVEQRHEDEVKAAEQDARKRVAEEHPEVEAAALEIKMSTRVKKDNEQRLQG